MEPNKLETEIKQKLEDRRIQPSEMAWDRLDAMLTVAEEKKQKKGYGWLYIAASFLGFILIGSVFFSQTEEAIDVRKQVVIENENPKTTAPEIQVLPTGTETTPENIASIAQKQSKSKSSKSNKVLTDLKNINQDQIAQSAPIINQKTETGIPKSKANADELLANMEKKEMPTAKPRVSVDPNYLLSQVDGDDTDLSFTQRVLVRANKNYQSVKTALANRNQE